MRNPVLEHRVRLFSSRLGIEPKTPGWLVQDLTTRLIGDLIPTISYGLLFLIKLSLSLSLSLSGDLEPPDAWSPGRDGSGGSSRFLD